MPTDEHWMKVAIEQAVAAAAIGEVPVGAVIVDSEGKELAAASNRTIIDSDPTGHAEIIALRLAGKAISIAAINGTPGGVPRGSFQPEVPAVGADPSNVCEVQFTPDHRGRAWVMAKVDHACARFRLLVRS